MTSTTPRPPSPADMARRFGPNRAAPSVAVEGEERQRFIIDLTNGTTVAVPGTHIGTPHGTLRVYDDGLIAATYAPGQWAGARKVGRPQLDVLRDALRDFGALPEEPTDQDRTLLRVINGHADELAEHLLAALEEEA